MIPIPSGRRESVVGDRQPRTWQGLRRIGVLGKRRSSAIRHTMDIVRVQLPARRAAQSAVERWTGTVPVREAAGKEHFGMAIDHSSRGRGSAVTIKPAQLGYLLEGYRWRLPTRGARNLTAECDCEFSVARRLQAKRFCDSLAGMTPPADSLPEDVATLQRPCCSRNVRRGCGGERGEAASVADRAAEVHALQVRISSSAVLGARGWAP